MSRVYLIWLFSRLKPIVLSVIIIILIVCITNAILNPVVPAYRLQTNGYFYRRVDLLEAGMTESVNEMKKNTPSASVLKTGNTNENSKMEETKIPLNFQVSNWQNLSMPIPLQKFAYPLNIDIKTLVKNKTNGLPINESVINPHPFKYIHKMSPCQYSNKGRNRTILILVKSAVDNQYLRDGVRETWGNLTTRNGYMKLVFLLGSTNMKTLQPSIDKEALLYQDIVQEDFIDAYFNNTYKTIMGFNWAVRYCPDAQFLFFVDDDHLVLIKNLVYHVNGIAKPSTENVLTGYVVPHSRPYRNINSKWRVPLSEYPYNYWPPYLAGGAFVVSQSVAKSFTQAFPYIKYLRIDDSYLGIVAKMLSVKPLTNSLFHQSKGRIPFDAKPNFIASHGFKNVTELASYHKTLCENFTKKFQKPSKQKVSKKTVVVATKKPRHSAEQTTHKFIDDSIKNCKCSIPVKVKGVS